MSTPATLAHTPSRFQRAGAVLGVALLLLLTISAVSPALHDWLHVEGARDANHQCAVVLFASGIALAAATIVVAAPRIAWPDLPRADASEIFVASPRYLRQPERGPPAC